MDKTNTGKATKSKAGRQRHPFKWAFTETSEAVAWTTAAPHFLFSK